MVGGNSMAPEGGNGSDAKSDGTEAEEDDAVFQLMIENKALECEKEKAEKDASFWKGKFEEMVSWVSKRDNKVLEELFRSPNCPGSSLARELVDLKDKLSGGVESDFSRQVKRVLVFDAEDGLEKKMMPSTPGIVKPVPMAAIHINDSDDDDVKMYEVHLPSQPPLKNLGNAKGSGSTKDVSPVPTPKKKRAFRVVSSDSDSDDDDHVPISRLKKLRVADLPKNDADHPRVISSDAEIDEDDESEDQYSDSDTEGGSLNGFIVSDGDNSTGSEDDSDSEVDFEEVISTISRRKRVCKSGEWKFEGDMLAAFGKDPELCMKAVCALYRQQTADERVSKETFYSNGRGFSKFDAPRGSNLGQFLTERDPKGDLKKTVEELHEHDSKALELCRTLATRYSKQLFEIYQKKEDLFFLPR